MKLKWSVSYAIVLSAFCGSLNAQDLWSGILSPSRAATWANAGVLGGIPSATWTQCGSTIAPYGSSASPGSPAAINNAIAACGSNQYVLLGSGDFYLNGAINLKSNIALRGGGANVTKIHIIGSINSCGGNTAAICMVGTTYYGGCATAQWPCPPGNYNPSSISIANWISSYSQGSRTITLDKVTGIIPNVTPIVLDQCDTGYSGSSGSYCTGSSGSITAASVVSGGTGYAVNDTGTIACQSIFGDCYGAVPPATYTVTAVNNGAVTAFTITNGGGAYTYTDTLFASGNTTHTTSGGGSGFTVKITGITGYDNNGFFISSIPMIAADQSGANTSRSGRSQSETVLATAISGTGPYTVTLSNPIMHPNWGAGQGPQAWWGNSTITNAGVENLMIDLTQASSTGLLSAVAIVTASNVWVRGIASSTANFFHVPIVGSTNVTVRDSYFYWTKNGSTTSYGIGSLGYSGNCLLENNIIQGVVDPINMAGASTGCVADYNFSVNQWDIASQYLFSSSPMHAAGTDYILEEGNIGAGSSLETVHGPHLANTFYRNYFNGAEPNNGTPTLYDTNAIAVEAYSRYNNYVGNVLGTPGYHTIYQCSPTSASQQFCSAYGTYPGNVHVWDIGWSKEAAQIDNNNNPPLPNDLLTASSLFRWGNWDSVNNSVQWNISEVPTADPNFPVSVPTSGNTAAGQAPLPASFLYSSRPSWWPSNKAWPPIGPDVSTGNIGQCTGGTYNLSKATSAAQCTGGTFVSPASTAGAHAVSTPAMDCYFTMGGRPDGTGAMLSFNADTCYGSSGSKVTGNSPNPPSNLNATAY